MRDTTSAPPGDPRQQVSRSRSLIGSSRRELGGNEPGELVQIGRRPIEVNFLRDSQHGLVILGGSGSHGGEHRDAPVGEAQER